MYKCQAWTLELDWPHKADFTAAPVKNWTVAGKPAGELRSAPSFPPLLQAAKLLKATRSRLSYKLQAESYKAESCELRGTGELRSANGFQFLRVFDAGHMVPRDQPAAALAMLNAFISNTLA